MCKGNKEEEENGSVRGSDNHSNGKEDDDNSWRSSSSILRKLRQQLNEHMPASFSDNNKNDSTNDDDKSSSVSISKKERRQATDTVTTKAREATEAVSEEAKLRERQEQIIWRDFTFLVVALLAGCVMSFVEMNVADVAIRGGGPNDESRGGILDAGFILTKPLHDYLEQNRGMNDLLAAINSLIGVLGPFAYMGYQTAWVGDFDPIFRYLAISAIRSLCGWVTFLPPDKSYLASHYDFPDIAQCLIKDCGDPTHAELSPFVTFFSGHVATLVICANHMYLNGFKNWGIFFHIFDIFQIIRLLATRGHYSIDIVIGWYMAVHVSNAAGRLGRHFSKGDKGLQDLLVPVSKKQAFESMTGVTSIKESHRASQFLGDPKIKKCYESLKDDEDTKDIAEPAARMMAEGMMDAFLERRKRQQQQQQDPKKQE